VIEITPLAGAIDVEPDTAVQVIFDRPLLVGGQATTFALEGPAGPVASTLRWVPADERPDPLVEGRGMNTAGRSQAFVGLELRPVHPLGASTFYTATVQGVQNASEIAMVGEQSWQFRTKNGAVVQNAMPVETSYYYLGAQRVALAISGDPDSERNGLFYIHVDHLGSTSLLSYGQGQVAVGEEVSGSRAAHLPFGEYRVEPEAGLSDRGFTGHRDLGGLGLVHMKARFYAPSLGRFLSADILVPNPADPQSYNRYAYVLNNPLVYRDPTGYFSEEEIVSYFGADSWLDVIRLFREGGELEGLWGWLRVLREAELGDRVTFWDGEPGADASRLFDGVFWELDSCLVLIEPGPFGAFAWSPWDASSQNVPRDGTRAGGLGQGYSLSRWGQSDFFTAAAAVVPEFHAGTFFRTIDWGGLALDAAGIALDAFSYGTAGRTIDGAATVLDSQRLLQLRFVLAHGNLVKGIAEGDLIQALSPVAGLIPVFGTLWDAVSIGVNLTRAADGASY
jgi:RHS repeat-associated protein